MRQHFEGMLDEYDSLEQMAKDADQIGLVQVERKKVREYLTEIAQDWRARGLWKR